jgi:hypothetical protein
MADAIPFQGFTYSLRHPRLYRPGGQMAGSIDNLYTELLFFKRI